MILTKRYKYLIKNNKTEGENLADNDKKCLIIQSDMTILAEVHSPGYSEARNEISKFAELHKSPEHIHNYRITPISLWNAASLGLKIENIVSIFDKYSKYSVSSSVINQIEDYMNKFGIVEFNKTSNPNKLSVTINDKMSLIEINSIKSITKYFVEEVRENQFIFDLKDRGTLKQKLIDIGYPVKDIAGFKEGEKLEIKKRETTKGGKDFIIRDYQKEAAEFFYCEGSEAGGHGVIVLPCGSGKTIVGIDVMSLINQQTLILAPNVSAVHQWIKELIDKTELTEDDIGEYTGERKVIRPVTIATYQILVYRNRSENTYPHFDIFKKNNWGLIIYDEVHLLPAPIFRVTAEIQSMRRLGLTATLVREDGNERYVFSLIGPKRYDIPWRDLERKGFIAEAFCHEIRVPFSDDKKIEYISSKVRTKLRIAAENPEKMSVIKYLLHKHIGEQILVIGQYISQLKNISKELDAPMITGKTPNKKRDVLYEQFRQGEINILIVSKVANFAIDLPDASIAIQVSGTFGSRQEEAQRLGRILRPKNKSAYFYSIVTKDSVEQEYAMNRQLFLTEQGYAYIMNEWE